MADQIASDLIMKFVKNKNAIEAETQTEIDLISSPMTKDFKKGYFFEVQSFTMSTGLDGSDSTDKDTAKKDKDVQKAFGIMALDLASGPQRKNDIARALSSLRGRSENAASGFDKWRKGQNFTKENGYPVDMDPFEITRSIDKTSANLWSNCIKRISYDSATLIKRKAAGGKASGEAFLRIDFTKVLVIDVDWDQDEPIKEKLKFISRAVTINYRPQLPDGSLGASVPAFWTANKIYKPVNLNAL
jgi:type VI protein secretion system component Hcp